MKPDFSAEEIVIPEKNVESRMRGPRAKSDALFSPKVLYLGTVG